MRRLEDAVWEEGRQEDQATLCSEVVFSFPSQIFLSNVATPVAMLCFLTHLPRWTMGEGGVRIVPLPVQTWRYLPLSWPLLKLSKKQRQKQILQCTQCRPWGKPGKETILIERSSLHPLLFHTGIIGQQQGEGLCFSEMNTAASSPNPHGAPRLRWSAGHRDWHVVVSRGSSQTVTRPSNFYFFVKNPFLRTAVLKPQIYVLPPLVWAAHEPQVENPPMQIARKGSLKTHAPPGLRGAVREGFFPAHRRPPARPGSGGKGVHGPSLPAWGWLAPRPRRGGLRGPPSPQTGGGFPPPTPSKPCPALRSGQAAALEPRARGYAWSCQPAPGGGPGCRRARTLAHAHWGAAGVWACAERAGPLAEPAAPRGSGRRPPAARWSGARWGRSGGSRWPVVVVAAAAVGQDEQLRRGEAAGAPRQPEGPR